MFNFYLSWDYIHWTRPSGPVPPPPKGLEREFIKTPDGDIEILSSIPSDRNPSFPPVVFAHGGMGCAWMWTPYMRYLAARGITSYAISTRGHGNSWHPSFLRMLYTVTKRDLGDDLLAGIKAVEQKENSQVVLVGHSSGGGLSQFLLNEGDVKVKGLALLGAVPGTGSYKVYLNWARFDPWFSIRMLIHGWHSNSPLSHPFLVRRAFFSDDYPDADLQEFTRHLNRYESFLWPLGMLLPFTDPRKILRSITGWGQSSTSSSSAERVLIMAGTGDKMMTREVQENSASTFRAAYSELVAKGEIKGTDSESVVPLSSSGSTVAASTGSELDNIGHGVQLAYVPGAGHHLQNDTMWEIGAEKLFRFLEQL
ncbi:Alpha/Beta hydrolase protein [Microdochium trichocladiopsis]|uniref:Alpha/Beta hydrolase protein n=1 Tax=Microdochium trichocladiopsis TaxID=1682393 RepID=A0A9P8YGF9_9PEZI|nr:Alpha/Beta hydrolase protein [Microdochium trichocladiopsis]KAH7039934.1 Alpha/Beta hydrolase protein [Microdochium trichocladiopsis]